METSIRVLRPQNSLIVFANHPKMGLRPGLRVRLVHEQTVLGQVRFIQIEDDFAVANIFPGTKIDPLSEGSTLTLPR